MGCVTQARVNGVTTGPEGQGAGHQVAPGQHCAVARVFLLGETLHFGSRTSLRSRFPVRLGEAVGKTTNDSEPPSCSFLGIFCKLGTAVILVQEAC